MIESCNLQGFVTCKAWLPPSKKVAINEGLYPWAQSGLVEIGT